MKNNLNNFGRNSGKIWKILNIYGPLSKNILIKKTKLKENDFYAVIG